MDIVIKALEPGLIDDFLYFFDEIGFVDNPDWSSCYCQYYHFGGSRKKWAKRTKDQNRDASKKLIFSGKMKGFLAYLDEQPIGWCNVNAKENYSYTLFEEKPNERIKIAAVVCFLIASDYRKKGIARLLLKEACRYYKDKRYDYIEAYPIKSGKLDAHNYHGPYSLYLSEDFIIIKELELFYVMRKKL